MAETKTKDIAIDFASDLKETDRFKEFINAKEKLENNNEAQDLLNEFEEIQKSCQLKQANNNLSKEDLKELQRARRKLNNNEIIKKYFRTYTKVRNLCQESFDNLSNLLGMDLMQYISNGGGSC